MVAYERIRKGPHADAQIVLDASYVAAQTRSDADYGCANTLKQWQLDRRPWKAQGPAAGLRSLIYIYI